MKFTPSIHIFFSNPSSDKLLIESALDNTEKIVAKINAFQPNPGCWFDLEEERVKIIKAIEVEKTGEAGTIIDNKMTIACSKNAVQILELKKEGKNLGKNHLKEVNYF